MEAQTLGNIVSDVQCEALVNTLAYMLAEVEAKALLTQEVMCISRHYLTCETTC